MSSTHCVDNVNQVHIKDEDGIKEEHCLDVHEEELSILEEEEMPIEEGEEDNLEGTKLALETKAYLDTRKCNIEHLLAVVGKFGILLVVQEHRDLLLFYLFC
jgi:hypothetical protein